MCDFVIQIGLCHQTKTLCMKLLWVFTLILLSSIAHAQNYREVDSIVAMYPRSFWSPEKLSHRVNTDFASDSARARAFFFWMTKHVAYDVRKYKLVTSPGYSRKFRAKTQGIDPAIYLKRTANIALRKRMGICGDYAALFQRLCDLSGLQCVTISGSAKTKRSEIGKYPSSGNHAWNAVRIGGEYRFIDVTWGAGGVNETTGKFKFNFNDAYFFTPPDLFFLKHFPHDKGWLFSGQTDSAFTALPLYHTIKEGVKILSPSGIIDRHGRDAISFRIRAHDNAIWSYRYSKAKTRFRFKVDHTIEEGITMFEIPSPLSANDYLTLYRNGLALATFKVRGGILSRTSFAGGVR